MGEGAALFLLKRLADAERDGDRIYAVLRGVGGASDGKGKGITAPNPVGQRLAVERAWATPACRPATVGLVEAHGTSTARRRRGRGREPDRRLRRRRLRRARRARSARSSRTSATSRRAAGAAGLLKAALALHHKLLPPCLNFERPNPNIDFGPLAVLRQHRAARVAGAAARRAPRRRQRLRLRRHQLPRRARGVHARAPERRAGAPGRRVGGAGGAATSRVPAAGASAGQGAAARRRWSSAPPTTPSSSARLERGRAPRPRAGARRRRRRRRPRRPARRRCGWRSTTATPPSWPTRPARRSRPSPPATRRCGSALRAAGHLPRQRPGAEGRLPLHRPGLAVRQHAAPTCATASRSSPRCSPRPTAS